MSLVVDIEKKLGKFRLKVAFEAENGVLALLGASGCGKSMTLKCIAGIETPDCGRIVLDGVTLFDSEKRINLPPQKRRVGYLFQQYALFPNMTVVQNIRCGLRGRENADSIIADVIHSMHLDGLENKRPAQLSGGQQQRVALARILVNEPEVLLLDEPFSALDSHLRFQLEKEVRDVVHRFGKSVLLVSHDRDEVFRLSDRIAVMRDGGIEVIGTRKEVFARPRTRNGAILTGCKNISAAKALPNGRVLATDWGMELELDEPLGDAAFVGIRMHNICAGEGENCIRCRVVEEIENPFDYVIMLRPEDASAESRPVGWELEKEQWQALRAETVTVSLPRAAILLLKER